MSDYPTAMDGGVDKQAHLMNQQHAQFNSPNSQFDPNGSPGQQQVFAPGPGYDRYSAQPGRNAAGQPIGAAPQRGGRRELKIYVTPEPSHTRAICFFAGVLLMFKAFLDIIIVWDIIYLSYYVVNCFLFGIGAAIAIINGVWALPTQEMLIRYCYMLHTKDGRALIFVFLAAIVTALPGRISDVLDYITGFWLLGSGIMCAILHVKETGGFQQPMPQAGHSAHVNAQDVYGQM